LTPLHEVLGRRVDGWREDGYPSDFPAIAEILEYAVESVDEEGERRLRFLRPPQLRALETYWYLRLVEGTPRMPELYRRCFPKGSDLLDALGLREQTFKNLALNEGVDGLLGRIGEDKEFASKHKLESLWETLTLDYPNYILALAMGAGKTILIGAIIATEFAMALEYPEEEFVQNALVFAPGLVIVEALRQIADIPWERILPPRLCKEFAASFKLTFTRDGEKDIPVVRRSLYNLVVTNTEKIRIQKRTVRKHHTWSQAHFEEMERQRAEEANLRLQTLASLPNLGIFSDEAHHTHGQDLEKGLKRVRQTVNYLAERTNVVCVVNTTGTPYFKRQPLRDVVVWYSLSEGIEDNILKQVSGNIRSYSYATEDAARFVAEVVNDFFEDYGEVTLPNGAPARLAMYFPQTDDLEELRPVVETTLVGRGLSPAIVLRNTNESTQAEVDAFNRLNDPASPHRVMLLVNKGTEGWDCPSLFACALARELRSANNFVLQASSRCLRQVPGNMMKARIYLSQANEAILDRELQDTYGERVADLNRTDTKLRRATISLRKLSIPPLVVRRVIRRVVRTEAEEGELRLVVPEVEEEAMVRRDLRLPSQWNGGRVLQHVEELEITSEPDTVDLYTAAVDLAGLYRLDLWMVYDQLRNLYAPERELPEAHLAELAAQIGEQVGQYEVEEETVEVALALVKPEGFEQEEEDGQVVYTADITYHPDRERLLLHWKSLREANKGDFGFHYTPYNFDSGPEREFFEELLRHINVHPDEVEDIYFTGALTDPNKTDFYVEYLGEDGRWHNYTPDFIIRRKDGRCYIVEIKSEQFHAATDRDLRRDEVGERPETSEGRKAVALRRWVGLNAESLKYEIVYATDAVPFDGLRGARAFVEEDGE